MLRSRPVAGVLPRRRGVGARRGVDVLRFAWPRVLLDRAGVTRLDGPAPDRDRRRHLSARHGHRRPPSRPPGAHDRGGPPPLPAPPPPHSTRAPPPPAPF